MREIEEKKPICLIPELEEFIPAKEKLNDPLDFALYWAIQNSNNILRDK